MFAFVGALEGTPAAQGRRPQRITKARPRPLTEHAQRALAVQVALDRAGFSPGEIDARAGEQTSQALRAFQAARELPPTGTLDKRTRAALGAPLLKPLVAYVVNERDLEGPFIVKLPADIMEQSALPALGYTSVAELLAERFHMGVALLERLNPGTPYAVGRELRVPNVEPLVVPDSSGRRLTAINAEASSLTVTVSARARTLTVTDAAGNVRLYAPVSVGSERDPLPSGKFRILGVYLQPVFYYNPGLFWDADPAHAQAKVAPGPNNPVGYVWLDLDQPHLGLHGTPEPASVGRSQSHGCIRLTNWDALRLASLVGDGTRVSLQ